MSTKQATRSLIVIEGTPKPTPDCIIRPDYEDRLRYEYGIDVPQTTFDMWNSLRHTLRCDLDLIQHGYWLDATTEEELKDLHDMIETCERHRSASYQRSKRALLACLRDQGVTVAKRDADYFRDE